MCLCMHLTVNPLYRSHLSAACASLLLVGLLLHLVAVLAPCWALERESQSHPFEGIGLWRNCTWDENILSVECSSLVFRKDNPAWFSAVQILEALSIVVFLGTLMSILIARKQSFRHLHLPLYFLLGLNGVGVLLVFLAVVVFGVAAHTPSGDYPGNFPLGWAFYLDVSALCVFVLCPVFTLYLLVIIWKYPHAEMYPYSQ